MNHPLLRVVFALWLAATLACGADNGLAPQVEKLSQGDAAAKRRVVAAGAAAVAPLFQLLASGDARAASEARSALRWIAMGAGGDAAKQTAGAVRPFLDTQRPAAERAAAAELLGFVGEEADVAALAELLADAQLFEPAAAALSRLWGQAAKAALIEALGTPRDPDQAVRLIDLIAAHRDGDTLPLFTAAAGVDNDAVRMAGARAIGLLGDPAGSATLEELVRTRKGAVRDAAFDGLLALAEARRRAEDGRGSLALLGRALGIAATDGHRAGALAGLGQLADPAALPLIEPALASREPAVRRAAFGALARLEGPAALGAMLRALPDAPDEVKPRLIGAIAEHRDPSAARPLLDAARDDDETVALAAAGALGEVADAATAAALLELARGRKTSAAVRAAALEAAIRTGHGLADRGQGAAALAVLEPALEGAASTAVRREAILGIAKAARPEALPALAAALAGDDLPLRRAALDACLAIGDAAVAAGRRADALAAYAAAAKAPADEPRAVEAITKLATLGVHHNLAARRGAIATWWTIGPFPCHDLKGATDRAWFPESEIHLDWAYQAEGRTLRWRLAHFRHRKGWVVLKGRFNPTDRVLAYAYTELAIDRDTDAQLLLGRDDGLTVWLNGQELYKAHGRFSIDREEFAVDARLVKGINRILVKSTQGGGDWQFYVRVTDRKGAPLRQE